MPNLSDKFEGDEERCGFILKDGTIVEVANQSDDPKNAFRISLEDIETYEAEVCATWHTHPGGAKNLSVSDYRTFLQWSQWEHYIIGTNGTARYYVEDGDLLSA